MSHFHQSVMASQVLSLMQQTFSSMSEQSHICLDATFGRGGHSKAMLNAFENIQVLAIDRDPYACDYALSDPVNFPKQRFSILCQPFASLSMDDIKAHLVMPFDDSKKGIFSAILMDLGLSSPQIDQSERGFSFQKDGPLDMRMSLKGVSAADIINHASEKELGCMHLFKI